MKATPAPKLLLLVLFAACLQQAVLWANPEPLDKAASDSAAQAATSLAVPEPSSAMLIAALGLMLMLRRRRLQG